MQFRIAVPVVALHSRAPSYVFVCECVCVRERERERHRERVREGERVRS